MSTINTATEQVATTNIHVGPPVASSSKIQIGYTIPSVRASIARTKRREERRSTGLAGGGTPSVAQFDMISYYPDCDASMAPHHQTRRAPARHWSRARRRRGLASTRRTAAPREDHRGRLGPGRRCGLRRRLLRYRLRRRSRPRLRDSIAGVRRSSRLRGCASSRRQRHNVRRSAARHSAAPFPRTQQGSREHRQVLSRLCPVRPDARIGRFARLGDTCPKPREDETQAASPPSLRFLRFRSADASLCLRVCSAF
jgi:hypothetical protein